jgi:hypothetical protein
VIAQASLAIRRTAENLARNLSCPARMSDGTGSGPGRLRRLRHAIADGVFGTIGFLSLAATRRSPRPVCTCEEERSGGSLIGDIAATLRALRTDRRCDHHHR